MYCVHILQHIRFTIKFSMCKIQCRSLIILLTVLQHLFNFPNIPCSIAQLSQCSSGIVNQFRTCRRSMLQPGFHKPTPLPLSFRRFLAWKDSEKHLQLNSIQPILCYYLQSPLYKCFPLFLHHLY